MLQLVKTTSIQVWIPIYHSDVNVREHTSVTCQHYCKIVKLAALPHYDDTVLVPSRNYLFQECVLLAFLDLKRVMVVDHLSVYHYAGLECITVRLPI